MNLQEIFAKAPFFLLIFFRMTGFMVAMPFFNQRFLYAMLKLCFALLISFLLFPVVNFQNWIIPSSFLVFLFLLIKEVLVGILLGLVAAFFFMALELVGTIIGFQIAFSMARVVDPTYGLQENLLSVLFSQVGIILILISGIDHLFLATLARSFSLLPPGSFEVTGGVIGGLTRLFQYFLEIGLKIAFPLIVIFLIVDLVLALISKTAAKMQVFFLGLPIKIGLGLLLFGFVLELIRQIWLHKWFNFGELFFGLFRR